MPQVDIYISFLSSSLSSQIFWCICLCSNVPIFTMYYGVMVIHPNLVEFGKIKAEAHKGERPNFFLLHFSTVRFPSCLEEPLPGRRMKFYGHHLDLCQNRNEIR